VPTSHINCCGQSEREVVRLLDARHESSFCQRQCCFDVHGWAQIDNASSLARFDGLPAYAGTSYKTAAKPGPHYMEESAAPVDSALTIDGAAL
jgi:hypothetical protein